MAEEIVVEKPNPLRRRAIEGAVGTLLGLVIAGVAGPQLVSFLYKPPSGDAFNCAGTVSEALTYFIRLQLTAGFVGGVVLILLSFLVRRMWKKRREARAATT